MNADDWGLDSVTTRRTLDCILCGAVSSVSAMMFMEDSAQAAELARRNGIDAGLHLNLTARFSARECPDRLREQQGKLSRYLKSHRFAPAIYHPGLRARFEYVVRAQLEEYERLYGAPANRIDGHHHMHLCANVLMQELLPAGIIVRRNLSFAVGEKNFLNRFYRRLQDKRLARRHRLADFFFDLQPLEPRQRIRDIFERAKQRDIEIETHPGRDEEYRFLVDGELMECVGAGIVARGYQLRCDDRGRRVGSKS
ncbi:MAG TPA: ChbG/HpnK family deacetylase [Terracidiphilus sp.]|nr:ChbG/HpnK family deacetylase [Terracidiphilus sp.]